MTLKPEQKIRPLLSLSMVWSSDSPRNSRVSNGDVDLKTVSFREIEQLSHDIGRRIAQQLGRQFTDKQCAELYSDDYNCPTCGLECEAIKHPRTVETIDGPAEIIELKSFCPKCRRNFFPCAGRHRPR